MILLDTSGLISFYSSQDPHHDDSRSVVLRENLLILSPFVLAELDYLITRLVGTAGARRVLQEVARGAYELAPFGIEDVAQATSALDRYADLGIGLADASIAVLAERYGCYDILTLDQRHFRAMTSPSGKPFRLLPIDDQPSG